MNTEAYDALVAYRANRRTAITNAQQALQAAQIQREPLQKKRAQALLSEAEAPLTGGEIIDGSEATRRLAELDAEIDRLTTVLGYLKRGGDSDDEERLVRSAVEEQNANLAELTKELDERVEAVRKHNVALWKKIEAYIDARKALKEELTRRDGVITSAEGKPYAEDLKKSGQTGRIAALNVAALPLVTTGDVYKRFARDAR